MPSSFSSLTSRPLSPNELSYYLPSRASGVNDMYLHHHLATSQPELLDHTRINVIWAILMGRHPLLDSSVEKGDGSVYQFCYKAPSSTEHAISRASKMVHFAGERSSSDLIGTYLNGPRQLSPTRLSQLTISTSPSSLDPLTGSHHFEVLLNTTHFVGDGIALHTFMNDFYTLVGGSLGVQELEALLVAEWAERTEIPFPDSAEERLAHDQAGPGAVFQQAIHKVAFQNSASHALGGQTLPRASSARKEAIKTIVSTFSFSKEDSDRILKTSKAKDGLGVAHILFAAVNVAWARFQKGLNRKEPMLFYSALSLRNSLRPIEPDEVARSYFHLALGYYNITLPTFLFSSPVDHTFWHRSRSVKLQTIRAVKSKVLVGKSLAEMAERKERAVHWAKVDDEALIKSTAEALAAKEEEANYGSDGELSDSSSDVRMSTASAVLTPPESPVKPTRPINAPFLGFSLLGNLDFIYQHGRYPSLDLQALTTGSRQRQGGSLLFGYTLKGKLYVSLGWESEGLENGVIEGVWKETRRVLGEVFFEDGERGDGLGEVRI